MPREVPKTRETTAPPTLTAASYIIDDALKAMEHKDDPQTKVPTSVILTLAILAALAKELRLFRHIPMADQPTPAPGKGLPPPLLSYARNWCTE